MDDRMRRASDDFERAGELVQKEVAGAAAISRNQSSIVRI